MNEAHHAIQLVARLTGLSKFVIRIWEQRYRAVELQRIRTNWRLFSQRHIERLNLQRNVTQAGHSIGQVAQLPTKTLRRLSTECFSTPARATHSVTEAPPNDSLLDHLEKNGAIHMENLTHLGLTLDALRKPAKRVTR